jgi:hypothetical protein
MLQLAVLATVLTAAGCGSSSSKIDDVDQAIASWAQTLRTAGQLRLEGHVPAEYLRQTIEAATDSLKKLEKQLQDVKDSADRKNALRARILALSDAAEQIKLALEVDDNQQIKQRLDTLDPSSRRPEAP